MLRKFRVSFLFGVGLKLATMCALPVMLSAQAGEITKATAGLLLQPAPEVRDPAASTYLSVATAGSVALAVGEQGRILRSTSGAKGFRPVVSPVSAQLNSVFMLDSQHAWAVGHGGIVLASTDGGLQWKVQRSDFSLDQPLFSVYFKDASTGYAVGLWSLLLQTRDGGATWSKVKLPPAPEKGGDLNLFKVFGGPDGRLYIAAEKGFVLMSPDDGASWEYLQTGYRGSLWTGVALDRGVIVVAGLRGNIRRSEDRGQTWVAVPIAEAASVTSLLAVGTKVHGVGADGLVLRSVDAGATFTARRRQDRAALTSLTLLSDGTLLAGSKVGLVMDGLIPVVPTP